MVAFSSGSALSYLFSPWFIYFTLSPYPEILKKTTPNAFLWKIRQKNQLENREMQEMDFITKALFQEKKLQVKVIVFALKAN